MEQAGSTQKETETTSRYQLIPVSALQRNRHNPRGVVTATDVQELVESVRRHGILQPLIVQPDGEIIAGERRFVAAQIVGLDVVPAVIREVGSVSESEELALVENVQRVNLLPTVIGKAYARMQLQGLSCPQIAARVGVSDAQVRDMLAILNLPLEAQKAVDSGALAIKSGVKISKLRDEQQKQLLLDSAKKGATTKQINEAIKANAPLEPPQTISDDSDLINRAIDKIEDAIKMLVRLRQFEYEVDSLRCVSDELKKAVISKPVVVSGQPAKVVTTSDSEVTRLAKQLLEENREQCRKMGVVSDATIGEMMGDARAILEWQRQNPGKPYVERFDGDFSSEEFTQTRYRQYDSPRKEGSGVESDEDEFSDFIDTMKSRFPVSEIQLEQVVNM